jgi:hypothetical protein
LILHLYDLYYYSYYYHIIFKGKGRQSLKIHKRLKKRRKFIDIDLYIDKDDVIVGSHRFGELLLLNFLFNSLINCFT